MSSAGRSFDYCLPNREHSTETPPPAGPKHQCGKIRQSLNGDGFRQTNGRKNGKIEPNSTHHHIDSIERQSELPQTITVLVADDHPVVREGLITLINRQPNMHVIAEASNGREAVEIFFAQAPVVALLDLRMSVMDGIEAVTSICRKDPAARIAIITSFQNEEDVYRVLRAGAQGYILKDAPVNELIQCIRAVGRGNTWIPPQVGAKLAKRVGDQSLTPRETEVLHAVVAGNSNKEIGVLFNISEATVKVHMTHILEKLKVTGRTEAINVAVKRGLVRLDDSLAA